MFFSPASILSMWLRGILSVSILAGGMYLLYLWYDQLPRDIIEVAQPREMAGEGPRQLTAFGERLEGWRPGWDQGTALLAGGLLLLTWTLLGSWIYPRPFRRAGNDNPGDHRRGEVQTIARPDGTVLNVECFGPADRPRLILTHGWGCDRNVWHFVQRRFSTDYRVVVWDLPGLGLSTEPQNGDYSIAKMANDLRAVLEATGNQPAILVGHSIGGMISLTFCALFTDLMQNPVAGIVVAHTTYTNPLKTMHGSTFLTLIQKPVLEPLISLTILLSPLVWVMNCLSYLNGSAHRSTERQSFAGTESKAQLDFAARYSVKASPKVIARGAHGMLRYDVTAALAEIKVPSLVVVGDQDSTTKPQAGTYISSQIAGAALSTLNPAKHLGFFEHHDRFNQSLQQFASDAFTSQMPIAASTLGSHPR